MTCFGADELDVAGEDRCGEPRTGCLPCLRPTEPVEIRAFLLVEPDNLCDLIPKVDKKKSLGVHNGKNFLGKNSIEDAEFRTYARRRKLLKQGSTIGDSVH